MTNVVEHPRRRLARQKEKTAYLMLAPTLILLALIVVLPLIHTLGLSFMGEQPDGRSSFVGLNNYTELLRNHDFQDALGNTLLLMVTVLTIELILAMAIALLLKRFFNDRGFLGAAILIPWIIPTVVSARLWGWMYDDVFGVFNDILLRLNLISQPVAWLSNPNTALGAIAAIEIWRSAPLMALLLLAGLQLIPPTIYEAAAVDGASGVKQLFSLTLPLLRPILLLAITFGIIDILQLFDTVKVMTDGANGTDVMVTYAHRTLFELHDAGSGAALSILLFLTAAVAAFAFLAAIKKVGQAG